MKFVTAPDDLECSGWFHRRISENNFVQVGVYRVMYGFRVRAGLVSDLAGCSLDWCGGGNWRDVERLYSMCINILSQREETRNVFDDIPPVSQIKPFYLDPQFVIEVGQLLDDKLEIISLELPKQCLK